MTKFMSAHPFWFGFFAIITLILGWLIFAIWPEWLVDLIGRKKVFLSALFNGITLGGLYFLVASGFTLIFGLMRNVNLAHGSLYLLGGYIGYMITAWTGLWLLSFFVAFLSVAIVGVILQAVVFQRMEGEELRQTLVTIGISIVLADIMLGVFGGDFYSIQAPDWLSGPIETFFISGVKRSGELVYLSYPLVRIVIFANSSTHWHYNVAIIASNSHWFASSCWG